MLLPLELPLSNDVLMFQLFDQDLMKGDDLVCSLKFSIKDILKTDSSRNKKDKDGNVELTYTTKWVNLYGCNKEHTGGLLDKSDKTQCTIQNENVEEAATFMGRLLIEYHTIDSKHPEMKIRDIDKNDLGF